MPSLDLTERYERALAAQLDATDALVPLLVAMAVAEVAEWIDGAHALVTEGEVDADGLTRVQIVEVLDRHGRELLVAQGNALTDEVQDALAHVESDYLERLAHFAGGELLARQLVTNEPGGRS